MSDVQNPTRRTLLKIGAVAPLAAMMPTAVAAATPGGAALIEAAVAAPTVVLPAWGWWAANDGGERFTLGPYATRAEAVEEARDHWSGEAFSLIEATPTEPNLRVYGDSLIEMIDGQNEDHWDRDGDCTIFTGAISKEAVQELGDAVSAVVQAWVDRHGIQVSSFAFGSTRNAEDVPEADTASRRSASPALEQGEGA